MTRSTAANPILPNLCDLCGLLFKAAFVFAFPFVPFVPLTRSLPLVSPFWHHRRADGVCPEPSQAPVLPAAGALFKTIRVIGSEAKHLGLFTSPATFAVSPPA